MKAEDIDYDVVEGFLKSHISEKKVKGIKEAALAIAGSEHYIHALMIDFLIHMHKQENKEEKAREKNSCATCRHASPVHGSSHHISCGLIDNAGLQFGLLGMVHQMAAASKENAFIKINGDTIKFNPHGIQNGYCNWPINFDPIWVDCYLNTDKKD